MITLEILILFAFLAFICELIDTSIGGGYGTILTPTALAFGIDAMVIIPAILFSEICTGFLGGFAHHRFKNVDWQIVKMDAILGFIGITIGVFCGVSISAKLLKAWIGIIVLACGGLLILAVSGKFIVKTFRLRNDIPLTMLCSFNKGLSGGGYGPISTAGLIIIKSKPKKAVGSTIFSEGIVCLIGFLLYVILGQASLDLNPITISISLAAILATLPGAYITDRLKDHTLIKIVAGFMVLLGLYSLYKI